MIHSELDALLDRVREDRLDPTGKNRNAVVYDCWRMFEDLAVRYKEEFAARDRDKALELSYLWQSIETAPKDGQPVFLWQAGRCEKAAYLGEDHGRVPQWYFIDQWLNFAPVSEPPKYWMPRPGAPEPE